MAGVSPPTMLQPWLALCVVSGFALVARGDSPGSAREGVPSGPGIAEFVSMLDLCFLDPSDPPTAKVDVPLQGEILFTSLCCEATRVRGLDISTIAETHHGRAEGPWAGDMRVKVKLASVETECRATYVWSQNNTSEARGGKDDGDADESAPGGALTMRLGTVKNGPFFLLSVGLGGTPLHVGGERHPWPGKWKDSTCSLGADVELLAASGAEIRGLRTVAGAGLLKDVMRSLVCLVAVRSLRLGVEELLPQVRAQAEELLALPTAGLGVPPTAPAGAGVSRDLRGEGPLAFMSQLLREGSRTGDTQELVNRLTGGTGAKSIQVGKSGMEVVRESLDRPSALSVMAFVDEVAFEGMDTISDVSLAARGPEQLAFSMGWRQFNFSIRLRAVVTSAVSGPLESLLERIRLRFSLSNASAAGVLGLLVDQRQADALGQGTSWYLGPCMLSMVQNVSLVGLHVDIGVDELSWDGAAGTKDSASRELEAEIDRSINSIMGFFNSPLMRPTVSRLVRGAAAGPVREAINKQLQAALADPELTTCKNVLGVGSELAVGFLTVCAIFACMLAVLAHRSLRYGKAVAAAFVAAAGACLVNAGCLGWPMRAAIRMRVSGASMLLYIWALVPADLAAYIPGAVVAVVGSLLFNAARFLLVVAIAVQGPEPHLIRALRWSAALGAWQWGFMYFLVGTQIPSFYIQILEIGGAVIDLGAQVNAAAYAVALGLLLVDVATLVLYTTYLARGSTAPMRAPAGAKPPKVAIYGLVICLTMLIPAPWFTLWEHEYSGAVSTVLRYDADVYFQRVSIASVFDTLVARDLNDRALAGFGTYILQALLFLYVVLAPIAHGALALCVGLSLRLQQPEVPPTPPVATVGEPPSARAVPLVDAAEIVEEAAAAPPLPARVRLPPPWVYCALFTARMLAGADAFAAYMVVLVPQLTAELEMLAKGPCELFAPPLDKLGLECMRITSAFEPGLFFFLFAGLGVRAFAELCAHGPLRAMAIAASQRPAVVRPGAVRRGGSTKA